MASASEQSTSLFVIALRNESEDVLVSTPVGIGDTVVYSYIHSADKTPVEQVFLIGEDLSLHLVAERYAWYGSGLEDGSGPGLTLSLDGDMVEITGYDRSFPQLLIRTARTVPQEFVVNGHRFLLSDLAQGGDPLVVYVSPK